MDTIDVVERAVAEHAAVWAAYAKSLHRKIAKLRKANRELEASYRKLAEREKALTESLRAVLDTCKPDDYEGIDALSNARDALALHKEDA